MDQVIVPNQEPNIEQSDYADSFTEPAEFDFLSEDQKKTLDLEANKLARSIQHYKAVFGNSNWTENIDKEILNGNVYSIQQALAADDKIKARNWNGSRVLLDKSLVTPTGQRVIMSENCANDLGLDMDSYITKDSLDQLIEILTREGVDSDSINKIKAAADKYGLIVVQNGIYSVLRPLLEDFLTRRNNIGNFKSDDQEQAPNPTLKSQFIPKVPVPVPAPTIRQEPTRELTAFEKKLAAISSPSQESHGADLEVLKHRLEESKPKQTPKTKPNLNNQAGAEIKREVRTVELPPAFASKPNINNLINTELKREVSTSELPAHLDPKSETVKPKATPIAKPVLPPITDKAAIAKLTSPAVAPTRVAPKPAPVEPEPVPYEPPPAPVAAPAPAPVKPIFYPRPVVQTPAAHAMDLASLDKINTIEDLKQIEPGHLRQGPLENQVQLIKSKIINLVKRNHILPFYVVSAFQQSPLFKIYLQIGSLMMEDSGQNRSAAFMNAASKLDNNLTLDEFEAVADLRKLVEQL